ncbi:hypothetical protein BDW74DRAFT_177295 [Aspergillus multicolor]|uniref:uncharacterized protein n=1 Tax=Aspergillus multicolor TaxID=41759 RepID=UPI003CCE3D58
MAWYSILPAELIYFESWVVRCFLFLGIMTVLPWVTLLILDMALYAWRLVTYYTPGIGGRARGMQRPRAPSLNELPDRFGLSATAETDEKENVSTRSDPDAGGGLKRRGGQSGIY